jgi:hypothetical protein
MNRKADTLATKNLMLLGAAVTGLISIVHAREFRQDVWSPAAIMSWHALSLLVGGVTGLITGRLTGLIPARLSHAAIFGTVAVLAAIGYLLQVSALLSVVFRVVSWE